jgi:hypothetical protein
VTVSALMTRIVAQCPGFAMVTHAMTSSAALTYPAAVVALSRVEAEPPGIIGVHLQYARIRFAVFIACTRRQDAGGSVADELDTLRAELRVALVGWQPPGPYLEPLSYAGGQLVQYQDGTASWREEFATSEEVRT